MSTQSLPTARDLSASAPGRICLFGEHQDYLGLPVIAAALNLRIRISGRLSTDPVADIRMPDIGSEESIPLTQELRYNRRRDYLRSAVNILRREGFTFSSGINGEIRGEIPINSGTSSSSALVVAWVSLLARLSDQKVLLDPLRTASMAYQAEVIEFSEPGGMMDQYSTACGGVIYLQPRDRHLERLQPSLGAFVLADSGEQKDTMWILARVKEGVLSIGQKLVAEDASATLDALSVKDINRFRKILTPEEYSLLNATIRNRDITSEGYRVLQQESIDHHALGTLLRRHHSYLRDPLDISTPKIESMIQAAYDAGALGAKINGSGGGGCMFAYAPENPEAVHDALKPFGRTWRVNVGEGVKIEDNGVSA